MGKHLETVKLWCRNSTNPEFPDDNITVDVTAEEEALVVLSKRHNFALPIPWEQIKSCYIDWQHATDLASRATEAVLFFLVRGKEYFVILTFYSAKHDMDMTIWLFIGNTLNNSLFKSVEKEASKLAKTIWTIRSEHMENHRRGSTIVYR